MLHPKGPAKHAPHTRMNTGMSGWSRPYTQRSILELWLTATARTATAPHGSTIQGRQATHTRTRTRTRTEHAHLCPCLWDHHHHQFIIIIIIIINSSAAAAAAASPSSPCMHASQRAPAFSPAPPYLPAPAGRPAPQTAPRPAPPCKSPPHHTYSSEAVDAATPTPGIFTMIMIHP